MPVVFNTDKSCALRNAFIALFKDTVALNCYMHVPIDYKRTTFTRMHVDVLHLHLCPSAYAFTILKDLVRNLWILMGKLLLPKHSVIHIYAMSGASGTLVLYQCVE